MIPPDRAWGAAGPDQFRHTMKSQFELFHRITQYEEHGHDVQSIGNQSTKCGRGQISKWE
jgi:hypothetical protein